MKHKQESNKYRKKEEQQFRNEFIKNIQNADEQTVLNNAIGSKFELADKDTMQKAREEIKRRKLPIDMSDPNMVKRNIKKYINDNYDLGFSPADPMIPKNNR